MKIVFHLVALLLLPVISYAAATVSAARNGRPLALTESAAAEVERAALRLVMSCDYEAPSEIASDTRWRSILAGNYTHVVFAESQKVTFTFSATGPQKTQEVSIREILVPVSVEHASDYIFIRCDGRVRAFAKYHDREALLALQKSLAGR